MSLQSRNAVVTGSTSGIGLAIARALAREGAGVMLNGFGAPDEIEALRRAIAVESGVKAFHSPGRYEQAGRDRGYDPRGRGKARQRRHSGQQRRDTAVFSPIEDFPLDAWDAIIAINLSSAFHTMRAAIPGMKARRWGRIINTASAHSLVASPFKSAYVAAKHGIAGLTKTAALELATFGVTVNCISPGYVWTPLVERQIPDTMKARDMTKDQVINDVLLASQPTKQFVTVDQVASLAVYLASDSAAQMTGANLSLDGGWTAA